MKKLTLAILVLTVLALALTAAGWPARLTVINRSGDAVYIRLGDAYPQLTAANGKVTRFTVTRAVYAADVTACGMTASGVMDLRHNLKLNFTDCDAQQAARNWVAHYRQNLKFWNADWCTVEGDMTSCTRFPGLEQYLGEPSMEKPNWWITPGELWRFFY